MLLIFSPLLSQRISCMGLPEQESLCSPENVGFLTLELGENYIVGKTGNNKILYTLMMQKYNRMIAIFNHRLPVGFIIYTIVYITYT